MKIFLQYSKENLIIIVNDDERNDDYQMRSVIPSHVTNEEPTQTIACITLVDCLYYFGFVNSECCNVMFVDDSVQFLPNAVLT